jgi:hypothetical protein
MVVVHRSFQWWQSVSFPTVSPSAAGGCGTLSEASVADSSDSRLDLRSSSIRLKSLATHRYLPPHSSRDLTNQARVFESSLQYACRWLPDNLTSTRIQAASIGQFTQGIPSFPPQYPSTQRGWRQFLPKLKNLHIRVSEYHDFNTESLQKHSSLAIHGNLVAHHYFRRLYDP